MNTLDVVVVGGGQAGLGIGYFLQQAGHSFVIFERERVGETWRSQRTVCYQGPLYRQPSTMQWQKDTFATCWKAKLPTSQDMCSRITTGSSKWDQNISSYRRRETWMKRSIIY